jgi:uncharacterized membrane protein (DUF106 family)
MANFLDTIFNPWLGPVLNLPPFWAILIISAGITLLITIVYKYTTNQKEMKTIKEDLKKYQKEMRQQKDPKKMMATQKKALDLNMKYMMSSFKSTLYTFIPIIIIFAWLNAHIAYYPLYPNQDFTVTANFGQGAKGNISMTTIPELTIDSNTQEIVDEKAVWTLKGAAGDYKLVFDYNTEEYEHNILVTEERTYLPPEKIIKDSKLKLIVIGNEKVHPFGDNFNIFGWYPGWLATYIILSLVFSTGFRKLFNVY